MALPTSSFPTYFSYLTYFCLPSLALLYVLLSTTKTSLFANRLMYFFCASLPIGGSPVSPATAPDDATFAGASSLYICSRSEYFLCTASISDADFLGCVLTHFFASARVEKFRESGFL